ncbi:undecaprenyl-diphosphate phosphatase [Eubacterium sp.]|uniref:undecaprenyl-diphosphate phosphatase n=1 Tax=Eubacterium sp. TaxID=142586 RepID=UPI004026D094
MSFIEMIKAIILGIVEGVTEWLPISSTGHMILVNEFLKLNVTDEFREMFLVVIQLGAILAVVVLYWKSLWPFGIKEHKVYAKKDIWSMWFKVIVSCIPAGIVGILDEKEWFCGKTIDGVFYNWQTVSIMLIIFGILFIIIENANKNKNPKINTIGELTYNAAFIIGVFQCIAAVFPGTSRSGATIVGAILIGVSCTVAAEYTFFLAVPVMVGASGLKLIKYIKDFGIDLSGEFMYLIVGMVVAFVVSIFAIKFLMSYIKKHDFKAFGWYRIVLGALVIAYFALIG